MIESIKQIYQTTKMQLEQEQERAVAEALSEAEQKFITPKEIELENDKQQALQKVDDEYQEARAKVENDFENQKRSYRDTITSRTECAIKNQFAGEINEINKKLNSED